MDTEDKMLKMFHSLHPDFEESRSCSVEVNLYYDYDEEDTGYFIRVMKGGNYCWGYTQAELLFEYLTKDWENKVWNGITD